VIAIGGMDDKQGGRGLAVSRAEQDRAERGQKGFINRLWSFGSSREVELTVGEDLRVQVANRAASKAWGIPLEKFPGVDFAECFTNPEAARDLCAQALEKGQAQDHILELKSPTGEFSYLQCMAVRDEEDTARVQVTAYNITDRKSMPSTLFESQEMFRNAFEYANIGLGLVDFQGKFFDVNKKLCELLCLSRGELVGVDVKAIAAPDDERADPEFLLKALESGEAQAAYEKCYVTREQVTQWVEISYSLGRAQTGTPICVIASFRDVNERKQLQAMLEAQASLDPLTKALARMSFEERAGIELSRSGRHGHKLSLLLLDLDYFRVVNDKYGMEVGDKVLSEFCEVARSCLRMTDLMGRWGGEEFAVLLPDTPLGGAKRVAERIRSSVEKHHFFGDARITVSIGVTVCREDESLALVLDRADDCVFNAKQEGRNRVVTDQKDQAREIVGKTEKTHFLELRWKKPYSSGNADIDAEHKRIFHITNRILATMMGEAARDAAAQLVDDLLIEIALHFAHEDEQLARVHFPDAEKHGQAHRKLLADANDLADRLKREECSVGELAGFVIEEIVANHILKDDPLFYPWFAQAGPPAKVESLHQEHAA